MNVDTFYEVKDGYQQARIKFRVAECQGVIIVGLDGWNYSVRDTRKPYGRQPWQQGNAGKGLNVRMSMNGPLRLSINEWRHLNAEIEKAYSKLLEASIK